MEDGEMNTIIIGCGRVGSELARALSLRGQKITVIDKDPEAFARLGENFKGKTVTGIGFDQDILLQAGIKNADALAAVTASDAANVVAARIARQFFNVPRVAARVYDPRTAEIYQRLGLWVISPVRIGVDHLARILSFAHGDVVQSLGTGDVKLVDISVPAFLDGRPVKTITIAGEIRVVAITRKNKTFLPDGTANLQEDDLLHLAVLSSSMDRLKSLF
jgi:trk system potassium uptake protein TrkA